MASSPHARFEELVAGFALSALEPEDEQELVRHLPACAACERDLAEHRETLAHLAYAADLGEPPASMWDAVRASVTEVSGPSAFSRPAAVPPPVVDLAQARRRRTASPKVRRIAAWTSVAAGVALVGTLGYGLASTQQQRDEQGAASARLQAAVRAVETSPASTVPLTGKDGRVTAVAVVQADRLSLIVDGLARNDAATSVYVLWGQSGAEQARALATFDVQHGSLDVVRDLPLSLGGRPAPELYVITKESGRTAPASSLQPALATGRAA